MILTSLDELKKYDKVFLSDEKINLKLLDSYANDKRKKILILFVGDQRPKNIELFKQKKENITFKSFSWSLFCHKHYELWHADKLSIKNSKYILKKISIQNRVLISFFKKIYSSKKVELCFEKAIALSLKEYYKKIKIYELIKEYNFNIIPIANQREYFFFKNLPDQNIFQEIKSDFHEKVLFCKRKFYLSLFYSIIIFIFYPLIALLSIRKFVIKKEKKNIGLRIYKQGYGFNANASHLDWIIDQNYFDKEKSLFIFEDSPNKTHYQGLVDKNYNFHFCSNRIPLKKCSIFILFKILFIYFPLGLLISPIIFISNKIIIEESVTAWTKFFTWKNFISIYKINSYLSYHNFTSDHIYRNIFLRKSNCLTIMYKHSHSAVVFDYKNKNKYGYADFMNSYYDIEYHWSKIGIEMSQLNESKSDQFLISGPIWTSQKFINKNYMTNVKKKKTLVAFFTTQFLGYFALNSLQAHEKFLLLAHEIIKNYPDFNIILKPKFDPARYEEYVTTKEILKNLLKCENFKIAENGSFSTNINMASDIVISMPFASSGFEAMCLGKKSFYVDLMNTYQNSYYDKFQKLVSHSSEQAIDNFKFWINVDQQEVNLKYKEIFENLGIWNNTNRAAEIIKNKIISAKKN